MKRYGYWLSLFIIAATTLVIGPLKDVVFAAQSNPAIQVSLNWVNECDISGTIIDTVAGSPPQKTPVNLSDVTQGCIQDWNQNGSPVNVQYIDNSTCETSTIWADPYQPTNSIVQGDIYYSAPGASGACEDLNLSSSNSITIGRILNANIVYVLSQGVITRVDNNASYSFKQVSAKSNLYQVNDNTGGCNDTIVVNGSSSATLWELSQPANNPNSAAHQTPDSWDHPNHSRHSRRLE